MEQSTPPSFSVVIPAYNRADLLRACLHSVLNQTYPPREIIVVDDGSPDHTPAVIAEFADRNVRGIRQPNSGQATARNTGAQTATADYILFLDCDDLLFPWSLHTYARVAQAHNNPAVIMGSPLDFTDESKLASVHEQPLQAQAFPDFIAALSKHKLGTVGSMALVVRRDIIESCKFSPVRFNAEDLDYLMKLGVAPGYAHISVPHTVAYRQHATNSILNFSSTARGMRHIIRQERNGNYPGGDSREFERRRIVLGWSGYWQYRATTAHQMSVAAQLWFARMPLLIKDHSIRNFFDWPLFLIQYAASRIKRRLRSTPSSPES